MEVLQIIWYVLLGVLLAAFLICAGFDIGAEILLAFVRDPRRRQAVMREIAPFWDGNQVWLVTAGGALFAAFPRAYSEVLSLAYIPVILLLVFLIFRVAAIEFFLAVSGARWRCFWADVCAFSGLLAMVVFGVALGSMFGGQILVRGDGGFWVSMTRFFTPHTVAAAALCVTFCAAQGASYMALKYPEDGDFDRCASRAVTGLVMMWLVYIFISIFYVRANALQHFWGVTAMFVSYLPLTAAMRLARRRKFGWVFAMTSLFAILAVGAHMIFAYPYIVPPAMGSAGISIFTASSSRLTLEIMLGVAAVGVPLALGYFIYSHIVFARRSKDTGEY